MARGRKRTKKIELFPSLGYFRVVGFCSKCGDVKVQVGAKGAKQCGCSGTHMLDRGFPRVKKPKKPSTLFTGYPDWMRAIVLEMESQGLSPSEVEALTGISGSTVRNWLKTAKTATRKIGGGGRSNKDKRYPEWMRAIVRTMYAQGLSYAKINALTGVGTSAASAWVRANGGSRSRSEAMRLSWGKQVPSQES